MRVGLTFGALNPSSRAKKLNKVQLALGEGVQSITVPKKHHGVVKVKKGQVIIEAKGKEASRIRRSLKKQGVLA